MPYHFVEHTGDIAVALSGRTLAELFGDAAAAFTDSITALDGVEPKRPEEVDVDAPELDLLQVENTETPKPRNPGDGADVL